jgi:hypothetical protein
MVDFELPSRAIVNGLSLGFLIVCFESSFGLRGTLETFLGTLMDADVRMGYEKGGVS